MSNAVKALSTVGAALVALAVFVPYVDFGNDSTSILDLDAVDLTYGFALEPLAVAIAALSPLVLTRVSPQLLGMLLAAIGGQTALMFLGYLTLATQGDNDIGPGSFIGIGGALLILTAGVLGIRASKSAPSRVPDETQALPPKGWYQDPLDDALERLWDGAAWTEETR